MLAAHKMIISKPKRVGAEFTNLADGVTGVMLRLETQWQTGGTPCWHSMFASAM